MHECRKLTSREKHSPSFASIPVHVCRGMDRNKRWEKVAKYGDTVEFLHNVYTQDTPREFVERDAEYLHRNWPINAEKGIQNYQRENIE